MKGKVILQFDYNLNSYVGQYFVIIDSKTEQNNSNGRTHGKGIENTDYSFKQLFDVSRKEFRLEFK